MLKKKIKAVAVALVLVFSANSLFALEEYVSEAYKQIDRAFVAKSDVELNSILAKYQNDKYYYLMENYTQKKIRRLVVNEEYKFALDATVVVIENNLDNEQAVDMYAIISESYEAQKIYEQQEEQKRQVELARIEGEKEKQRASVDKEYVAAKNTDTAKTVYVTGKETKLTSYYWNLGLAMADLSLITEEKKNLTAANYGISVFGTYEYNLNDITFGFDADIGLRFLSLTDGDSLIPLMLDMEIVPKFSHKKVLKNLFFRAGLGYFRIGTSADAANTTELQANFVTPIIGAEFEKIRLGPVNIEVGVDWYAGHLFYENVNFAMGAKLNLGFTFAEMQTLRLNFNIGLKDKFLLKESGLENRANLTMGIGVENVIR